MARTTHGILKAYHGTTSSPSTEIGNLVADESMIEFLDEEGNPVDPYGNQYAGVMYAQVTIMALDLSDFVTIRSNWTGGTKQYFKCDLSNSATVTTAIAVNLVSIRPINIQGRVQGRSDGFVMVFRCPYDSLTFA